MTKLALLKPSSRYSSSSQTGSQIYMAPELLAGKPASTRSDIYSLGVVLYQLLVSDLTRPLTTDWADHISDPLLREDLEHCFAGDPQDRFAGAGQLAKNLRALPERRAALEQKQAELVARERAAYRLGIVRTSAAGVFIVALVTVLAFYAVREKNRAMLNERSLRRQAYGLRISQGLRAWENGDLGQAADLLESVRPRRAEEDLRGFEWRYLWGLLHRQEEIRTFPGSPSDRLARISKNGELLAVDSGDGTARLLDVETGRKLRDLPGHEAGVRMVQFVDERNTIATVDGQNTVRFWDLTLPSAGRVIQWPAKSIQQVALSGDGTLLATVKTNGEVSVRAVDSGQEKPLPPVTHLVGGFAFSPDAGTLVATSSEDARVTFWDVAAGRVMTNSGFASGDPTFSPNSRTLALRGPLTVDLWNVKERKLLGSIRGHLGIVGPVAFSPNSQLIATGSADRTVGLSKVSDLELQAVLTGHPAGVISVAFSNDRTTIGCRRLGQLDQALGSALQTGGIDFAWAPCGGSLRRFPSG